MNAAEKKVVRIAIFLFAVGTLVRFAPWGLPAIENVDIADRQKHAQDHQQRDRFLYHCQFLPFHVRSCVFTGWRHARRY